MKKLEMHTIRLKNIRVVIGALLSVVLILDLPLASWADDLINKGARLDLNRCIEIALKIQPDILAARNTVRLNESRIGQAKANYYPQINLASGYSRSDPPQANRSSVYIIETPYNNYSGDLNTTSLPIRVTAPSTAPYNNYSSYLNLTQNIYDFGKTADQVKIQSLYRDSSRQDLGNVTSQTVFYVKQAYFSLLQVIKNWEVAVETVKQFQQHLDQAKGFFEVGTKPKFDVTKAEVDLSNAKLNLLTAENNVKIARVNLNNAMGLPEAPDYTIEDNLAYQPYEISFEEALKRAYAERPDLLSILLKRESQLKAVDLAKTGYYPYLTGTANYGFESRDFPLDRGWTVGAQLTFPIFSGHSTRYQVEEARASLDVLKANEEALRQSIYLDVKQSYLNLQVAKDQISTAELTVRQAHENLDLANGRYAAGVGNPIEVTDAAVAQANAKTAYIAALYNYKIAKASMEKAMGAK